MNGIKTKTAWVKNPSDLSELAEKGLAFDSELASMGDVDERVEKLKEILRLALACHKDRNINAQALIELAVEMHRDGIVDRVEEALENL